MIMENIVLITFLCVIIIGKWSAILILPGKYLVGEIDKDALHSSLTIGIIFFLIGLIFEINDLRKGILFSSFILFVYAITAASGVIAFTKVIIEKRKMEQLYYSFDR